MASAEEKPGPKRRRATTPEARENQLIAAAVDLAEKQILDGTASAQIIGHFLKLATRREQLEQQKLIQENLLLKAKTESLSSASRMEELVNEALKAMKAYTGNSNDDDIKN